MTNCKTFDPLPLLGEKTKIKNGEEEREIGDNVQRSQLIVQTLSKVIGQLDPKVYGERTTLAGDPSAPLVHEIRGMKAVRDALYGKDGE